ncbi:MAG: two-component system, sensor histidine kinase and response regulator [Tenuifilum sp.]|uniref:ATP-binding protein n=1 Tax=Tenuifilum sp. TaxID=2760880 RepID=UPI0024AAA08C|nr:ATP-binding protein [Tenuifilum sp.]MDI3526298.1 two-component system, sensor histidine kinase and response regulator [Tenuifilum sp.]
MFKRLKRRKEIKEKVSLLKTITLFREVDERALFRIASVMEPCEIKKGDILFNKGDKDFALYLIVSGRVKIHDGNHTFTTFGANQYFGEYSLLDSTPRSTSVTAIEDTKLLRLDQEQFNNYIFKIPSLARGLLLGLVWRLRDYNVLEEQLTSKNLEIKRQKEELEIQRKELEQLNHMKDRFFAIIAHDLRNPFSTVLSLSELLAKEFSNIEPENLKLFIEQLYRYSNKTFNLLENLLQWSMLQTGRLTPKPQQANLSDIISDTIDLLSGNASKKLIRLNWVDDNDYIGYFDVNMITTVIRNLISNAIKFTPQNGEITVSVKSEFDKYRVFVKDNGVGMSKEIVDKLFRIDTNPSTPGTNDESGTGLGLILCKDFVEKNNGSIGVESEVNKGSTFYFTIPRFDNSHQ